MRVKVYYEIIASLTAQMNTRKLTYENLNKKFSFLLKLQELTITDISQKASELVSRYPEDLDDSLILECLHFKGYLESLGISKPSALSLCKLICDNELKEIYPKVSIALKIFLCMLVSNCYGKRSFSVLARIKNYLRAVQTQDRLN